MESRRSSLRRSSLTDLLARAGLKSPDASTPSRDVQQPPNGPHVGGGLSSSADTVLPADLRATEALKSSQVYPEGNPFAAGPQDSPPASPSSSVTVGAGMSHSPSLNDIGRRETQKGKGGFINGMKRSLSNLGSHKGSSDTTEPTPPQSPGAATPRSPGSKTLETPKTNEPRRNTFSGLKSLLGPRRGPRQEGKQSNPEDLAAGAKAPSSPATHQSSGSNWNPSRQLTAYEQQIIDLLHQPEFMASDFTTTGALATATLATNKKLNAVVDSQAFREFCKKGFNLDMLAFYLKARELLAKPEGQAISELIADFRAHQTGAATAIYELIEEVNLDGESHASKQTVFNDLKALSTADTEDQPRMYAQFRQSFQLLTNAATDFLTRDVLPRFLVDIHRFASSSSSR